MTRSYTLKKAVKEAMNEMSLSREKLGTCEVISGPLVAAYKDPNGTTKLDILDHGFLCEGLSVSGALDYANYFFDRG